MSALRLAVSRGGERSLITADRLRVDAEMEFQLRVIPTAAGVGTAVQALGAKALRAEDLRGFFEGKFIDAMQAAAAERTMDELHENAAFTRRSSPTRCAKTPRKADCNWSPHRWCAWIKRRFPPWTKTTPLMRWGCGNWRR